MKSRLVDHLVCPACQQELVLAYRSPAGGDDIETGELVCRGCRHRFSVVDGVPRLVEDRLRSVTARTRRQYDFTWRRFGQREIAEGWEKDSQTYLSLIPPEVLRGPGAVGLEAGCGGGADLLRVAERGAEIIGIDLSAGVDSAHRVTRHLPNVHVVQADVTALPFRPGHFDFVYSFGVLHHLPEPARGFRALARVLKPGAPLTTYLYEDFADRSAADRAALALIRGIRTVTSRLPAPLLYGLCWAGVPPTWLFFSLPAYVLRDRAPAIAGRLPFRHTRRWPVLASDLFDRFAPPVEWRYSRAGVRRVYEDAGFERVESRQYRGWVSWGFRMAAVPVAGQPR